MLGLPPRQQALVPMKTLGRILLKGLLTILPVGLTAYLVYWLGLTTETLLSGPLKFWLPAEMYRPGLGLLAGFIVMFVVGLLVNAYIVRRVLQFGESLILRIPVVKTVYSAIRDLTGLMNKEGSSDLQRVVLVPFGAGRSIGFVTQENATLPGHSVEEELVAVYMPMSYQIGGYTVYVRRDVLEPTDLSVEAAMRIVLTGGLQNK